MTKFRPNLTSIMSRLIIFGLTILCVGAIGRTLLLGNYLRKDIVKMNSAQLLTLANYAAQDIDHNITERCELLKRSAAKLPLNYLDKPERLRQWLAERHEINPLFSLGFLVLDTNGIALTDYPAVAGRVGTSFADRDYFRTALQGQLAIGRPVLGRASKLPVLPMGMPIRDQQGKIRAVLVGASALDSPNFLDALKKTRVGNDGGLVLVSPQDELFVGASHRDLSLTPTPKKGQHRQHDRAMQGFRGVGIDVNLAGEEELAAVVSVPSSGWFLVARLPTEEVYEPITRLQRFIIGNAGIMMFISIVILVIGLRYLLGPLRHAAQYADRMTLEEIPLEPLPVVRNDEVGHLTKAFNRVLTKLLESREEMQHLAHHDILTGLPNRKLLADNMKQAFARSQRNGMRIILLFLDLDGFKPINDELGHDAGDQALRQVASRLHKIVRCEDTLARVGGDEFVIFLADQGNQVLETAAAVAGKCQEIFETPFELKGELRHLGVSIGIAIGNGENLPGELLADADQAMYNAKQAGGGAIRWADNCRKCQISKEMRSCSTIPVCPGGKRSCIYNPDPEQTE